MTSELDWIANNIIAIARGIVPGHATFNKWAHNESVGTSYVPVWQANVAFNPPDGAEKCNVVSSDVADSSAGAGARTILVIGNNEDNHLVQEIVTMNGTTNVLTTNKFSYILRALVLSHGSATTIGGITGGGGVVGTITITQQTSAKICAYIHTFYNTTQQLIFKVPVDERWISLSGSVSASEGKTAEVHLFTRPGPGSPWLQVGHQNFFQTTDNGDFVAEFEPGSEVVQVAKSSNPGTAVATGLSIIRIGEHVNNGGP